ncbi:hypothetical protein AYI69_g5649 [Smittium culicis]|uniref:RNA-directed DNA polymerase from mobile element jockey n=1 Tax=Smittium culicis TaxID=133412 RepID=A0A1R1Y4U7_9FUNG|nr:hypothetical protein AYI69_g5649 [Smittium culicis]
MAVNASKCAIMAVNCDDPAELTLQRQTISTTYQYTYLGYIMNPKYSVAGTIKNNKLKAMYAGYYFLNRSDVLTELKIRLINSVLLPIGCYGGETFGMSENRCRPIQTVIDQATRMVAKVGKNAAMERIREELGISSVFLRTSTARERAFIKWAISKTWIADLTKQLIKAEKSTWVTECSTWIKKYCTKSASDQTVTKLARIKAKNNKSKIQHGTISHNISKKGSWICLQAMHPTLRLGLQYIGRMRMGSFWTAQCLTNAKITDRKFKLPCPSVRLQTPGTADHILLDSAQWSGV